MEGIERRDLGGRRAIDEKAWRAEAIALFGDDMSKWAFVCPVCKHVATVRDWQRAGAPEGAIGFSCVGRWLKAARDAFGGKGQGPCNYAGGGLFAVNPVRVTTPDGKHHDVFEFAASEPAENHSAKMATVP